MNIYARLHTDNDHDNYFCHRVYVCVCLWYETYIFDTIHIANRRRRDQPLKNANLPLNISLNVTNMSVDVQMSCECVSCVSCVGV